MTAKPRARLPSGEYRIQARWDNDAQVWVATSDDVPGLATEGETLLALHEKLEVMVPELLEANGLPADRPQIFVHIDASSFKAPS